MLRETLNSLSRLIPGSAERNRNLSKVQETYSDLRGAYHDSREFVLRQPIAEQDVTIDNNGAHLKDLALKTADAVTKAVDYNPYGAGLHYFEVGSGYWYHIGERRLVQRKWGVNKLEMTRPDFGNALDASARDWYIYGLQVADRLIAKFVKAHELPASFRTLVNSPV